MQQQPTPPKELEKISRKAKSLGYQMGTDSQVGALLRTLCATKPGGRFLELGTGIGASLCWILDGVDDNTQVISLDNAPHLIEFTVSIRLTRSPTIPAPFLPEAVPSL